MNTQSGSRCFPKPEHPTKLEFVLPFNTDTEVVCTHGSKVGSHAWPNSFYALDLATPYEKNASIVRAAAPGKAFVFLGDDGRPCPQPEGTPRKSETSACGMSWGNRVKILHENGFYSFYVHLDKTLVKTGDLVKQGQAIGTEGWTGAAGHRHLHWSIHKLPGQTQEELEQQISWDGQSVPFYFEAALDGKLIKIDSDLLSCPHANIGQVPKEQQPRLRGVLKSN